MIFCVPGFSFESNSYIVVSDKVVVIDPGINAERVLGELEGRGLSLDFLVNTHCHFDHVAADKKVIEETSAKLCVHELDARPLEEADSEFVLSGFFGGTVPKSCVDFKLCEGSRIDLGGITLDVFHTPGHTQGSICLYEPASKSLFTGDTVFADGVGRTDFPGGSFDDLKSSVERLTSLVSKRHVETVYPGHGGLGSGADILKVKKMFF